MRFIYLLPVVSHVRYHKRIRAMLNLGIDPVVFAFERNYYEGKPVPGGYESLGSIEHTHYFKRIMPILKALFKVRLKAQGVDVIYAFGLDMLLLGWLACLGVQKPVKLVYEIGDIREIMLGTGLLSRFLRWFERFLLRRTELLIVTSEAFISCYFKEVQQLKSIRHLVIENKLDQNAGEPKNSWENEVEGILRIGYFGVLRCRRSWEILKKAVLKSNGRIQLYLRGITMSLVNLEKEANSLPGVEYAGPYAVPDHLPFMYGRVNMVWACYPYQEAPIGNYLWARTNRFYESCSYKVPMFAQKDTEDGRVIDGLGLGLSIDMSNVDLAVERILSITEAEINRWQQNINRLAEDLYTLTNEHEQLLMMLKPYQTLPVG